MTQLQYTAMVAWLRVSVNLLSVPKKQNLNSLFYVERYAVSHSFFYPR
jgi:hypothetical protein